MESAFDELLEKCQTQQDDMMLEHWVKQCSDLYRQRIAFKGKMRIMNTSQHSRVALLQIQREELLMDITEALMDELAEKITTKQ
jgi:hypothetical protein